MGLNENIEPFCWGWGAGGAVLPSGASLESSEFPPEDCGVADFSAPAVDCTGGVPPHENGAAGGFAGAAVLVDGGPKPTGVWAFACSPAFSSLARLAPNGFAAGLGADDDGLLKANAELAGEGWDGVGRGALAEFLSSGLGGTGAPIGGSVNGVVDAPAGGPKSGLEAASFVVPLAPRGGAKEIDGGFTSL